MPVVFCTRLLLLMLPLLLLGCLGMRADNARLTPRPGIDAWSVRQASAQSVSGCRFDYRVFEPDASPRLAIVLAHGFLRDQDRMIDLATALAAAGFRTLTLDLCSMRPWNGHHRANAEDMRALATLEGLPDQIVYAGFSAGALAALLAGADDPTAVGVLTLDLVDQAGLGTEAVTRLNAPLLGLSGPDSSCNANGNARAVFERAEALANVVPGASHCEFESPTNWLCELACGDETPLPRDANARRGAPTDQQVDAAQRRSVIELAVAAVESLVLRP